jgi:hypothetical protein
VLLENVAAENRTSIAKEPCKCIGNEKMFLLSPQHLAGTYNSLQNCIGIYNTSKN